MDITVQHVTPDTALQYTEVFAALDGQMLLKNNTGNTVILVRNGNGTARTLTVKAVGQCSMGKYHDEVYTVVGGSVKMVIGPFPPKRFGTTVTITHDIAASDFAVTAINLGS